MKITFFNSSLEKYLTRLERPARARARRTIDLLEKYSYKLRMPYSKQIKANLYELRVKGRQEVRIFYCFHRSGIVLLHAFVKKSQKIPEREVTTALLRIKILTGI